MALQRNTCLLDIPLKVPRVSISQLAKHLHLCPPPHHPHPPTPPRTPHFRRATPSPCEPGKQPYLHNDDIDFICCFIVVVVSIWKGEVDLIRNKADEQGMNSRCLKD